MEELIKYFDGKIPVPTTIDQKIIDIQVFTKANSKIFKNCLENNTLVSIDKFITLLPRNSNKILFESSYRKLLDYNQDIVRKLLILKFVDKNRKVSSFFNKLAFYIFYGCSNFYSKKEKVIKKVFFDTQDTWNDEQIEFIQLNLARGKLIGIPGGGKTKTIIGKVTYLICDKAIENNGFIVLAFSKNAVDDFVLKLNHSGLNDRVKTIHSLAGYMLNILSKGVKSTTQSIDTCVYKSSILLANTQSDIKKFDFFKNVKCIFVDEAQDISRIQFEFIKLVSEKLSASLILVGDSNQAIYKFQNGSDEFINNWDGFEIELVKNYRSTKEIIEVVNRASPNKRNRYMESAYNCSGPMPKLFVGNMEEILLEIEKYFSKPFTDKVAIIAPVKKSRPSGKSYMNIGLNTIVNHFERKGIKYNKCFDDSETIELSQKKKLSIKSGIINLLTIHGSKGLEFDRVILLNYHFSTFTQFPKTESDYQDLKYLWYVALSRAKKEIRIFSLYDKWIWPEHQKYEKFVICNKEINYPEIKFMKEERQFYSWTEIISDRKIFSEYIICQLQDMILFEPLLNSNYDCKTFTMEKYNDFMNAYLIFENVPYLRKALIENYNNKPSDIKDFDEFSILYGYWAEETFYHAYRGEYPPKLNDLIKMCNTMIQMDNKYSFHIKKIVREYGNRIITWEFFEEYKKKCNNFEFINIIESNRERGKEYGKDACFFLYIENNEQYYSNSQLREKIDYFTNKKILDINDIFYICLFYYQFDYEMKHLMEKDFSEHIQSLANFDKMIRNIAPSYSDGYKFQQKISCPILPINGVIDGVNEFESKILEIKFSETREPKWLYMFQALGYAEFYFPRNVKNCKIEVLNLYHFCSFEIKTSKYDRYKFYELLSQNIKCKLKNCCWIYDLETTGLIREGSFPKIMEIHVEELSTGIIPLSTLVKMNHFRYEEEFIANFNGITRSMCNNFGIEESELAKRIENILNISECKFVAHNGNEYDHKIVKRIIKNEIKFPKLDTLCIFPLFIEEELKSKKLTMIYEHVFKLPFSGKAHRAEADVKMMIEILLKLKISSKLLLEMSK